MTISRWIAIGLVASLGTRSLSAQPAPLARVGGPDDDRALLESPRDLRVVDGRIVVLERSAPFIRVFDLDGSPRQRLARLGSGPGEARHGAALLVDADARRLLLFDTPNGRAVEFSIGDSLAYVRALATTLPATSGCMLGSRTFVAALTTEGIVHEVEVRARELHVVRSYGAPTWDQAKLKHPSLTEYIGEGVVHCDAGGKRVYLASREVGVLHVLDIDRATQQSNAIAGFKALEFSITADGWLKLSMPASGLYDQALGFRSDASGTRLWLGRATREHPGAGDYAAFTAILIGPDGEQRAESSTVWYQVGRHRSRTVCYRTSPAPEVIVVATPRCPTDGGA